MEAYRVSGVDGALGGFLWGRPTNGRGLSTPSWQLTWNKTDEKSGSIQSRLAAEGSEESSVWAPKQQQSK